MEKITLQNNFSWKDVINFCEPGYNFGSTILERCSLIRSSAKKNIEKFSNSIQQLFINKMPDFDLDGTIINYMAIVKEDENGKNNLYIDEKHFLMALLFFVSNANLSDCNFNHFTFENSDLKADLESLLRINKKELTDDINFMAIRPEISFGVDAITKEAVSYHEARDILLSKRKKTVWILRHLDEILDVLKTPIDFNCLNDFDKDRFLLLAISYSLGKSKILCNNGTIPYDEDSLHVLNNYILLVDYIKSEGNLDYNYNFNVNISHGNILINNTIIEEQFNKFCKKESAYARTCFFATSYDELLAEKASESYKTINNKKLVANIKLNWEMIPSGSKVKLSNYTGTKRVVTNGKTDPLKLQKAYDLLEDKIEYFKNSGYLFELSGINTFEGYQAYMYNNGVVVFEKFFKNVLGKGKQLKLVPVTGEAIYAMNFREFAELSKYSKTELIQEMVDFNNTDLDRINHTSNGSWKNRVDKVISGPGYGGIDLDVVNDLSKDLVKKI